MHIQSSSQFACLYRGYPHDPTPVFRDLNPEAHDWPEGAVFAVTVHREDLVHPKYWPFPDQDAATEFIAADGWPVGLPEEKKCGYFPPEYGDPDYRQGDFYRGTPLPWRVWTAEEWEVYRKDDRFPPRVQGSLETKTQNRARAGAMAGLIQGLEPVLPRP